MLSFRMMSRALQALSILSLAACAAVFVAVLAAPDLLSNTVQQRNWVDPLPRAFLGPLVVASALFFAPGLIALWHMAQLFGAYATGDCLSPRVVARIQRLAQMLFLLALLNILWGPAMDVLHTLILAPEHGSISVGISMFHVASVLAGGLLLAIARALDEGYRALSENRSFV